MCFVYETAKNSMLMQKNKNVGADPSHPNNKTQK